MSILVTVCIPVYNGAKYLRECLQSVIEQTYTNIEILVVDDGSTDESLSIVKELMITDPRIRLSINEQNLGLVDNWKKCIEVAKASWIKFMFQDDFMEAECVEQMITASIEHAVPVCICGRKFLIEDSTSQSLKNYFTGDVSELNKIFLTTKKFNTIEIADIAKDKLFDNFLGEPIALLFNKSIVKQIGSYNEDLVQQVDYEFILRACLNYRSVFIPQKLVTFRTHSSSTSNNKSSNETKKVRALYVEPLIMFHEYLFNRNFKLLRKKFGYFNLLRLAITFYNINSSTYNLSKRLENYIFNRYKGLQLIKLLNRFLLVKQTFKKFTL